MKMPSLLMTEKIEPKILLMDKAVVTLLIRSFSRMEDYQPVACGLGLVFQSSKIFCNFSIFSRLVFSMS